MSATSDELRRAEGLRTKRGFRKSAKCVCGHLKGKHSQDFGRPESGQRADRVIVFRRCLVGKTNNPKSNTRSGRCRCEMYVPREEDENGEPVQEA